MQWDKRDLNIIEWIQKCDILLLPYTYPLPLFLVILGSEFFSMEIYNMNWHVDFW